MPKSFLAWVLFTLWNNVTVELGFLGYQFNADTNLFTAEAQRAQRIPFSFVERRRQTKAGFHWNQQVLPNRQNTTGLCLKRLVYYQHS